MLNGMSLRIYLQKYLITAIPLTAEMMNVEPCVTQDHILVDDTVLKPGYGQLNDHVVEAIRTTAESEGVLLDPTYTGKAMAGLFSLVRA